MDVIETIRNRRSIRRYLDRPVEDDKVEQILEAGRWAPSADNLQPWHFIVVRDGVMRQKLAQASGWGKFLKDSPVAIVVLGDPQRSSKYNLADPHNAVMNMILTAYSLGLGSCWVDVRDMSSEQEFKKLLHVPKSMRVICAVAIGYPAEERTGRRRPLSEIVSYETYE